MPSAAARPRALLQDHRPSATFSIWLPAHRETRAGSRTRTCTSRCSALRHLTGDRAFAIFEDQNGEPECSIAWAISSPTRASWSGRQGSRDHSAQRAAGPRFRSDVSRPAAAPKTSADRRAFRPPSHARSAASGVAFVRGRSPEARPAASAARAQSLRGRSLDREQQHAEHGRSSSRRFAPFRIFQNGIVPWLYALGNPARINLRAIGLHDGDVLTTVSGQQVADPGAKRSQMLSIACAMPVQHHAERASQRQSGPAQLHHSLTWTAAPRAAFAA